MGGGGSQVKEQLIMEAYNWVNASLTVTVRNVGSSAVTIAAIYVGGTSTRSSCELAVGQPIALGASLSAENLAIRARVSDSHHRTGAFPLLATLLILAVVISASMLIFVWTLGVTGN